MLRRGIERLGLLALLIVALALSGWHAGAQPAPADEARWRSLNAAVIEAYRAGDFARSAAAAEQALALARQLFGPRHPDTLTSMNNLGAVYERQARYGDAEPLLRETLQVSREALGPRHPDTLNSMSNLAGLYRAQGRYGEAEPLYRETLQLRREVLGPRHPDTLTSMSNLAALYQRQGRYGEAEPLYRDTLQLSREVLGPRHPDTLGVQLNFAVFLGAVGSQDEAVRQLRAMEPQLLSWLGSELYSSEAAVTRRQLVAS
jgi:tetratricopeptide (TPR) repeat protein